MVQISPEGINLATSLPNYQSQFKNQFTHNVTAFLRDMMSQRNVNGLYALSKKIF